MKISRSTAMRIVTDLSDIVGQQINMMDENGLIIASTDPERLGMVHGGSRKVLEEKLSSLIIHSDDEYPGSRPGLNLPIEIDGKYIGVIGITGQYEAIEKHGRIIKKMTEILLLDDYLKEQQRMAKSIRDRYIHEWVFDPEGARAPSFASRGQAMDIDIHLPRRVLAMNVVRELEDTVEAQILFDRIEKHLGSAFGVNPGSLVFSSGRNFIALIPERPDSELVYQVSRACAGVKEKFEVELAAGLDSSPASGAGIHESYLHVQKALQGSLVREGHPPVLYNDINIEIFIQELSDSIKGEYVAKIFRNVTGEEREKYVEILKVFFACNGSLQQTAERLFIHKNTLQYKLNKLHQTTGINPRTMEGSALYYFAIAFLESGRKG